MRKLISIFTLVLSFSSLAVGVAESQSANQNQTNLTAKSNDNKIVGQIYSDLSSVSVKSANELVTQLQDPTRISDSFRGALSKLRPQSTSNSSKNSSDVSLPNMELAAIIDGFNKKRIAIIRLDENTRMVRQGHAFTLTKEKIIYDIYVEKIGLSEIMLNINPPNQLLILR